MANRDHLQTLQQGVDAWNAWRDRQPLITPDLGGADLGRANLSEANLSEADLSEANLTEANLSEANLTEANLSEADLSEANLSEANLSEADLSEANLSGANLSGAYLGRANLKVNLSGVDLRGANLGRADLRGANLRGAKLRWADLRGVELSGADLGRANLSEADRSAAVSQGPDQAEDKAEYVVWYGTNRRPNDPADPGKGYSARRDRVVHYGSCRVFIPQSHKIGSIGSPWWKRLLTLADDRLRLLTVSELAEMAYWEAVVSHLAAVSEDERNALIFVHGYNISFEDAALRAAQIGFDLSVKGAMAFFSWPSRGVPRRYAADAATIEASEGMIADFMTAFAERSGAKAVHIIAHSMGNRGVLRAVNRIAAQAQRRTGRPFGQIILAAADVDADVFRQLCVAYGEVASRTTLYISKRDLALEASHWLHEFPRAGLMPPICIVPGIDTINVTNVDLTMLGHGYVADARDVLGDMHALIRRGAPPHERFGLRETTDEKGQRFWLIGA